jgi:outer membrane immunogenic protein
MKKILSAAGALLALVAGSATAADLSVGAPSYKTSAVTKAYDWTGVYFGGDAGGGWGQKCWSFVAFVPANAAPPSNEGCHNPTGWIAGGQIGALWQTGMFVIGLEARGDWAELRGNNNSLSFVADNNRTRINALGLVTGRLGMAWNNALFYVNGGGAVIRDHYESALIATGVVFSSASEPRFGASVGVGFEYGFTPNLSAAVEYDYVFAGTRTLNFAGTSGFNENISQNLALATVRLNYRFGGGPIVSKY